MSVISLNGHINFMTTEYLSILEAAAETGLSRQAIWKMVQAKTLKSTRVGSAFIIPTTDVSKLRRTRLSKLEKEVEILREREKAASK